MNRADIEARLKGLQAVRQQKMAEVNAIEGAMEDCRHWLSQIDDHKPAKKEKSK